MIKLYQAIFHKPNHYGFGIYFHNYLLHAEKSWRSESVSSCTYCASKLANLFAASRIIELQIMNYSHASSPGLSNPKPSVLGLSRKVQWLSNSPLSYIRLGVPEAAPWGKDSCKSHLVETISGKSVKGIGKEGWNGEGLNKRPISKQSPMEDNLN